MTNLWQKFIFVFKLYYVTIPLCTFTHQICVSSATFTHHIFLLALFWPSFFCSSVFCTISLFTLCTWHNRLDKSLSTRKFPSQGTACFCLLMLLYSSIWAELVSPCWPLCCFPPNYDLSLFNRDSYSVAVRSTLNTCRWVIVCTLILSVEAQSISYRRKNEMPLIYRRRHSWFYHSKSIMPYFEIIPTDV